MRRSSVVRQLAKDDDIAVAGPVLKQSQRLAECRPGRDCQDQEPGASACDFRPRRHRRAGDRRAGQARRPRRRCARVAENQSRASFPTAASPSWSTQRRRGQRAGRKVGAAAGHPAASVPRTAARGDRGRAAAAAGGRQAGDAAEIRRVLAKVSGESCRQPGAARLLRRAAGDAQRCAETASSTKTKLVEFAKADKYEETVAALADALPGADRGGGPADGRRPAGSDLILCKAAGFGWPTARGDHDRARPARRRVRAKRSTPPSPISSSLSPATAQRVMRFWQASRQADGDRRCSDALSVCRSFAEDQIARRAAFALGLGLVARAGKARPRLAPVVGALRGPVEIRRAQQPPSVQAA